MATGADVKTLSLSVLALTIKWFVTIMIQGGKRFEGGSRPPEDAQLPLNPKGQHQNFGQEEEQQNETKKALTEEEKRVEQKKKERAAKAKEADIRWQRIVLNDIENIPMGLIVAIISISTRGNEWVNVVSLVVFTLSRLLHTYFYANAIQPHRALAYFGGVLSTLVMAINGVFGVFSS